ncbi:MAG: DUF3408 domain-containing protein [Prevotellaceae bacterium]|jgi:hypothetical protein|nr:DUF3408 domain-containing protein [Prevotellaceae bacterium]
MKEEKSIDKKTGGNADMPFDTNEFIRQVSMTGSNDDTYKSAQRGSGEETPESMQAENQTEMSVDMPEPTEEKPVKRKRTQPVDYGSLFLLRNELRDRQGLYISRENYEILQTLVRVIRNERLSVSGLVDNIIHHHIELYGEEMNRIYDENSRKPIQKKQ